MNFGLFVESWQMKQIKEQFKNIVVPKNQKSYSLNQNDRRDIPQSNEKRKKGFYFNKFK